MADIGESAIPSIDIILASTSKRRRELLEKAGVEFTVRKPQTPVDETLDEALMSDPIEACKQLAERKAGAMIQELLAEKPKGTLIVIGADTMVVKDARIFGKPKSFSDGKYILRQLSGGTHDVITAVSIWMLSAPQADNVSIGRHTFADVSHVTFKNLTDKEISDYLREEKPFDKAGAYAIQGQGAYLVDHYEGSLDTIIGLPVDRLIREAPFLLP